MDRAQVRSIVVREYGSEEVLTVADKSLRDLGENDVLVEVKAAGVNPVDTYIREGSQGYEATFPYVPGKDGAGVILGMGKGVEETGMWKEGDGVYLMGVPEGTYGERVICDKKHVFQLPEGASFQEGACLGVPYFTAYQGLMVKGGFSKGGKVFIHGGSGGVGLAAVQFALQQGGAVAASAGSEVGMKVLKDQGVECVVDHGKEGYLDEVKEWAGEGVDVILEMLANRNLGEDLKLLGKGGRVVVIGCRGEVEISPRDLMMVDGAIYGVALKFMEEAAIRDAERTIQELFRKGVRPVVSQVYRLEEAGNAHAFITGRKACGQVVLAINPL